MHDAQDLRRLRFRFLEAVFDATEGIPSRDTNLALIAIALGLSREGADGIEEYLVTKVC
jgi:hypothetical protein